jgi:GNAT superfamily N-acetyltransferase
MKSIVCRELDVGKVEILRPLLEGSSYKPLRYLNGIPPQRICDWWQEEVSAGLRIPGGVAFVADVDGQPAGLCVLGDLPWESEILGKRMAAVKHLAVGPDKENAAVLEVLIARTLQYALDNGYDFLLCKTYTDEPVKIHALERVGFLLVDTLLDFVLDLSLFPYASQSVPVIPVEIKLRIADKSDRDGLVEVSRKAFSGHFGRFHSDPRLGSEWGRIIYERWIESCLEGWADWIVVADAAGQIAGYSAWKRPSEREKKHQIGLGHYSIGAIHPDFCGRGLFSALTYKGTSLLNGFTTHIEGPTHINNYPVQRGFHKLGWRIEDAHHSFHKWLKV